MSPASRARIWHDTSSFSRQFVRIKPNRQIGSARPFCASAESSSALRSANDRPQPRRAELTREISVGRRPRTGGRRGCEFLRDDPRKIRPDRRRRRLQHRHIILIEARRRQIYAPDQIRREPVAHPACSISAFTFCIARARRSRAHFRCAFCLLSEISWALVAWLLLPHYRRLARRNLEIAFAKEKSPRELRRIVRRHFQNLGANLICSVKMGSMPPEKMARLSRNGEPRGRAHRELRAGTPVVVLLSHIGNWELFAQLVPALRRLRQTLDRLSEAGEPSYRCRRSPKAGSHRRRAF